MDAWEMHFENLDRRDSIQTLQTNDELTWSALDQSG